MQNPSSSDGVKEDDSQQKQLICRAQTRSISPLIDIGRLKLISAFGSRIACVLPLVDNYGNKIDNVNEVELRHLVYWNNHNLLTLTPDEKAVLYCLYGARNAISHLNLFSCDDIQELFRAFENLICYKRKTLFYFQRRVMYPEYQSLISLNKKLFFAKTQMARFLT